MTTQADTETRNTVIGLVGNTPLLHLGRIAPDLPPGVAVYAKAEWANPGGSIKDRAALYMIRDGEQRALLRPGMRIADATSGNTGIAYATIGAALGYGVTLAMPRNATPERKRILYALGAELILTDPQEGMDEAIRSIRALVAANPDHYFYPDQYNNPANVLAHFETTAPEILQQTQSDVVSSRRLASSMRRWCRCCWVVRPVRVLSMSPRYAGETCRASAKCCTVGSGWLASVK